MKTLWAPWRIKYILGQKADSCIFCIKKSRGYKKKRLILHESKYSIVIMNKYPYSPGHLMVSPKRHIKDRNGLTKNELVDLFEQVRISINAVQCAFNPQGFNLGANLGRIAGAGLEDHLHFHIVARWSGDSNYMPVIGKTLIISEYLENTYKRLLPFFKKGLKPR